MTPSPSVSRVAITMGDPAGVGPSLARALNRLSSAVYVLALYFQAGKIHWKTLEK